MSTQAPAHPPPLNLDELRAAWRASAAESPERRLLQEIARLHRVLQVAHSHTAIIEAQWRELTGSRLAAIHQLRALLDGEPAVIAQHLRVRR